MLNHPFSYILFGYLSVGIFWCIIYLFYVKPGFNPFKIFLALLIYAMFHPILLYTNYRKMQRARGILKPFSRIHFLLFASFKELKKKLTSQMLKLNKKPQYLILEGWHMVLSGELVQIKQK